MGSKTMEDPHSGFEIRDVYIAELYDAFKFYDKDCSGTINTSELGTIVRSLGQNPTEMELQKLINQADADCWLGDWVNPLCFQCNGVIDFPEFVVLMTQKLKTNDAEETIQEAFRVFDMDGNGVITLDELKHVMLNMGEDVSEQEVDEILKDADVSNDGLIEYREFAAMLTCTAPEEGEDAAPTLPRVDEDNDSI